MAAASNDPLGTDLGQLALDMGYVSQEQLDGFRRLQKQLGGTHHLGALFVARGALTEGQLQELLELQRAAAEVTLDPAAQPQRRPSPPETGRQAPQVRSPAMAGAAPQQKARAPQSPHTPGGQPVIGRPPAPRTAPLRSADFSQPVVESIRGARVDAVRSSDPATGSKIIRLLEMAERERASDLHLHAAAPPALRVEGQLKTISNAKLTPGEQEELILDLLTDEQRQLFLDENDLDLALTTLSGLRCRVNVYRTQFGVDATFRLLRRWPPSLNELGLPEIIARFTEAHQGLVLVTGPAGSGKSTTLAALVDLINADRPKHILTLEDPIEIIHPEKRALVNQRQVGRDTESFARALRGALREDPDIIVIGELRDRETISLAVTAAETGHLVLGSMHTNSAARTVSRILDAFPPSQQSQVRAMVSESLKGIVSQRLVMGVDGRRVPAAEVLVVTPAVSNLIREGKLYQIRSSMQTGRQLGMRTLDEALKELVTAGRITQEEAMKHAESQAALAGPSESPQDQQAQTQMPKPNVPQANMHQSTTAMRPKPQQPQQSGGLASFFGRRKG